MFFFCVIKSEIIFFIIFRLVFLCLFFILWIVFNIRKCVFEQTIEAVSIVALELLEPAEILVLSSVIFSIYLRSRRLLLTEA